MRFRLIKFYRLSMVLVLMQSCGPDLKTVDIHPLKNEIWPANQILKYQFKSSDLGGLKDLLYQIQFAPSYPFQNIWLRYHLVSPTGDTLIKSTDNLFLFEPTTGKPLGTGTNERLYLNAYFLKGLNLKDTGSYCIYLQHYMRTDSLSGIQAVGLNIGDAN